MFHIDALLTLLKGEAEELAFNGCKLPGRAIKESLPLLGSPLRCDGSADLGYFTVPASQKLEGYAENLSGLADGEITLPLQAVALLQKHELLDESIPLADLAPCSPRRVEEDGARNFEREMEAFF